MSEGGVFGAVEHEFLMEMTLESVAGRPWSVNGRSWTGCVQVVWTE